MADMPAEEERIDEVLGLANELKVSFPVALKLNRAGFSRVSEVRRLSVQKFSELTGVPPTAAERVLSKRPAPRRAGAEEAAPPPSESAPEALEVEPVEIRPVEVHDEMAYEIHPIKGAPGPLGGEVEFGKYYNLDPNMKRVWFWSNAGNWASITLIIGLMTALMLAAEPRLFGDLAVQALFMTGALTVLIFLAVRWLTELTYENYTFGFTREIVVVREGIWFKSETHIPYGRIQNINSHQGILDRIFGVWHLSISATGAASYIHGVPDHESVKAFILENVEAVKARRAPALTTSQGYREVYLALKEIARALESPHTRSTLVHG